MTLTEALFKSDEDFSARLVNMALDCQLTVSPQDGGILLKVDFISNLTEEQKDNIFKSPTFRFFLFGAALSSAWEVY